jgi:RNase H-fold protein (predicted Holliday junction resolvase)
MSDSSPNHIGQLHAAHETRIQSLENTSSETRAIVAGITAQFDGHKQALADTRIDLAQRIEKGFDSVIFKLNEQGVTLKEHGSRLSVVEVYTKAETEKVTNRKDMTRKVLVGMLLAGSGIFVTKIVEKFLPLFGMTP